FLDLHGYGPDEALVDAAEALDRLLRRLGVAGQRIPTHLDDRVALWRDQLAGRRLLLLLDNVHDVKHVRPLLPGVPGCAVLITSRRRLTALDEARLVSVDVLSDQDAITLFTEITGASGPTEAVTDIVRACGRLPLAVRIAAARWRAAP